MLEDLGIKPIRTPYQAPNTNAWAERFVRSIQEECLNRVILFGEGHLRRCIDQYLAHYHRERNHQGLGNQLIEASEPKGEGRVVCSERLGGLLKFYSRAAQTGAGHTSEAVVGRGNVCDFGPGGTGSPVPSST